MNPLQALLLIILTPVAALFVTAATITAIICRAVLTVIRGTRSQLQRLRNIDPLDFAICSVAVGLLAGFLMIVAMIIETSAHHAP